MSANTCCLLSALGPTKARPVGSPASAPGPLASAPNSWVAGAHPRVFVTFKDFALGSELPDVLWVVDMRDLISPVAQAWVL